MRLDFKTVALSIAMTLGGCSGANTAIHFDRDGESLADKPTRPAVCLDGETGAVQKRFNQVADIRYQYGIPWQSVEFIDREVDRNVPLTGTHMLVAEDGDLVGVHVDGETLTCGFMLANNQPPALEGLPVPSSRWRWHPLGF